jgi:hypothetical protein
MCLAEAKLFDFFGRSLELSPDYGVRANIPFVPVLCCSFQNMDKVGAGWNDASVKNR